MTAAGVELARAHGWVRDIHAPPVLANAPNAITLVRTVAAVALAVEAIAYRSATLLIAAYACYWLGDILDGLVARRLAQETRFGAVFDILADRACTSMCGAALLTLRPAMALPIGLFLLQFTVVDSLLSLAFLRWPLLSPNYFALVDRRVYRWNWSPPAKAVNTGGLIVLVTLSPPPLAAAGFVLAVAAVKVVSLLRVCRMPSGSPSAP